MPILSNNKRLRVVNLKLKWTVKVHWIRLCLLPASIGIVECQSVAGGVGQPDYRLQTVRRATLHKNIVVFKTEWQVQDMQY